MLLRHDSPDGDCSVLSGELLRQGSRGPEAFVGPAVHCGSLPCVQSGPGQDQTWQRVTEAKRHVTKNSQEGSRQVAVGIIPGDELTGRPGHSVPIRLVHVLFISVWSFEVGKFH